MPSVFIPVYGRHRTWKCHAKSIRRHFFYVLIRKVHITQVVSYCSGYHTWYCNDLMELDHSGSMPFTCVYLCIIHVCVCVHIFLVLYLDFMGMLCNASKLTCIISLNTLVFPLVKICVLVACSSHQINGYDELKKEISWIHKYIHKRLHMLFYVFSL